MSEAEFKFFSVGHGLFHAGKIPVKDGNFFTFIYDCGSQTPSVLKSSINSCIDFFNGKNNKDNISKIDFLFVSHLHYDHINGIRPLIDKLKQKFIRVSNVVLPYVNLYQRVILLLDALNNEEQSKDKSFYKDFNAAFDDYLAFYKNPYNYLKKLFVNKDNPQEEPHVFYIVNAPSDCFISDLDITYDQQDLFERNKREELFNNNSPYVYDPEFNSFDEEYKPFFPFGERDKSFKDNKSDFDFLLKNFDSDASLKEKNQHYRGKQVILKVANDSLCIIVKDTWRFICFNTPLPSDKKVYIQSLYAEYVNITQSNGFKYEDIFVKDNINRLKKHYKKMSSDLNSTSLLIYHFPLDCKDNGNSQQKSSFLRKYSSFLLLGDVNLNSSVRYKSNNSDNKNKHFLNYLYGKLLPLQDVSCLNKNAVSEKQHGISYDRTVNFVMAPHHGADKSWNENIFDFLNCFKEPSVYIVSSSVWDKYHPGREFMKSFLNNLVVKQDDIHEILSVLLLPYPFSIDRFYSLFSAENYLMWCNETQSVDVLVDLLDDRKKACLRDIPAFNDFSTVEESE